MASGLKTIGQTPGECDIDPDWDAIVIGAGPAGAVTARQLAAAGRKTLLVDRQIFPRGKVCGGYLNGQALSVLASAGLGDALNEARPAQLHRFVLLAGRRRADLDLPSGVSINRADFDAALARAAVKAGACFCPRLGQPSTARPARPMAFAACSFPAAADRPRQSAPASSWPPMAWAILRCRGWASSPARPVPARGWASASRWPTIPRIMSRALFIWPWLAKATSGWCGPPTAV